MFHFDVSTCVSTEGYCPRDIYLECRGGNAGTFRPRRLESIVAIQRTPYILAFGDRINIWDFLENRQGVKESATRQGNLVDLYNLLAIGAVQKSSGWSERMKFPSKVTQGVRRDPLEPGYSVTERD